MGDWYLKAKKFCCLLLVSVNYWNGCKNGEKGKVVNTVHVVRMWQ
jgi:hypothetical protein